MQEEGSNPLTVGRIAVGVCLGLILALVVSGGIFYFAIQVPHGIQAQRGAKAEWAASDARLQSEVRHVQDENKVLDERIKTSTPPRAHHVSGEGVAAMKYPECASRPESMSLMACEVALSPESLAVQGCERYPSDTHAYRKCAVRVLNGK